VSAREIQQLRFVPFPTWFPAVRDPRAGARFYTVVQEDIYEALVRSQSQFREHRVIDLEILGNVVGADIRQYFTYLHGLPELLALPGTYCEQWVREFYASVWVSPDHSYIHYALAGTDYRVTAQRAREVLGLRAYSTRIHQLCYGNVEPPRRPHGGEIPLVDFVAPCFRPPFGEGSSRTVGDLTRPARILDFVLRKTLLPRTGYRDGFTRIQQWLVAHLISQTQFDLWDLIVSEIEDTISESFRGRRQLPYTHWITLLILRARPLPLPAHLQRELIESDTVFPHYDPRQMLRAHHDLRAAPPPRAPRGPVPPPSPRGTRSTAAVPEIEEQQDIAIGAFADAEAEGEFDFTSDSSDDDYQPPVSDLPPRAHDHEAGGSSSASDPALLAILEGMRADQRRAAEEQARRDRD